MKIIYVRKSINNGRVKRGASVHEIVSHIITQPDVEVETKCIFGQKPIALTHTLHDSARKQQNSHRVYVRAASHVATFHIRFSSLAPHLTLTFAIHKSMAGRRDGNLFRDGGCCSLRISVTTTERQRKSSRTEECDLILAYEDSHVI